MGDISLELEKSDQMKSTEILREEHLLINRMIKVVEAGLEQIHKGVAVSRDFLRDVAEFFCEFADKYHFAKEEGKLFEEMELAGVFTRQLPIESIRHDHHVGRAYINRISRLAQNCSSQKKEDCRELIADLKGFIAHIQQHSRREERVLYPLSDALIPPHRDEKVLEYFRQVDKKFPGYREKYSNMVEKLEREMGIIPGESGVLPATPGFRHVVEDFPDYKTQPEE